MISSDHLDPGTIGRIKATVATANISGPVLKHISIYSNDRVTPVVTVEVALDIVPNDVMSKGTATKAATPADTAPTHTAPK